MPKFIFRPPNIHGNWYVEGWVKYEIHDKMYEYREINGGRTKKIGQHNVSAAILRSIYREFPMLFKKFK